MGDISEEAINTWRVPHSSLIVLPQINVTTHNTTTNVAIPIDRPRSLITVQADEINNYNQSCWERSQNLSKTKKIALAVGITGIALIINSIIRAPRELAFLGMILAFGAIWVLKTQTTTNNLPVYEDFLNPTVVLATPAAREQPLSVAAVQPSCLLRLRGSIATFLRARSSR